LTGAAREARIAEMKQIAAQVKALEPALQDADAALQAVLLQIPNPPHPAVPDGRPDEVVTLRVVGAPPQLEFAPRDHVELAAALALAGTSEMALGSMLAGEVLNESDLPVRLCGISTCFRREAGAHGKDTRGIFRVHQFDKVEMFSYCHPDRSWEEHDYLAGLQERLWQPLGLPYRVVDI